MTKNGKPNVVAYEGRRRSVENVQLKMRVCMWVNWTVDWVYWLKIIEFLVIESQERRDREMREKIRFILGTKHSAHKTQMITMCIGMQGLEYTYNSTQDKIYTCDDL